MVIDASVRFTFKAGMSVGAQTHVQALASLLEVRPNVDISVHLTCVENSLRSVAVDGQTALQVSEIIQGSSFSPEAKQRLQQILSEQVSATDVGPKRRSCQDFTKLEHYLTDNVWDALASGSYGQATDALMSMLGSWACGTQQHPRRLMSQPCCATLDLPRMALQCQAPTRPPKLLGKSS